MSASAQIILASASPRRRELLEQIGVLAIVQSVDIDESKKQGESVIAYVQRLAAEKAQTGCEIIENKNKLPVLGSDTIIELGDSILGKPVDRQQAKDMLRLLSGKKHTVHTSVAIVTVKDMFIATNSTQVQFKELEEDEIDGYLATGEADDKAGSYAIQGRAAQFIKNINGSFSGVMGLPLYETVQLLKRCGIKTLG
ncbi:MAG: septum formation inhibitor Maf [Gammaproteobacteria bacterium]|jgi:septum formation protein|nr:septum formation inhibitor Maf [Gammaproteobacteria bacterium]